MGTIIRGGIGGGPTPPTPVVADFSASLYYGEAPLTVTFTDLSTGTPTSWLWNFGDGFTSTEQNPVHTFIYYGPFKVTLIASNESYTDSTYKYVITTSGIRLARIAKKLILSGNFTVNSDFIIPPGGVVDAESDEDVSKTIFQYPDNYSITANGKGYTITSTTGNITIEGLIDGKGRGFESNRGPGCNSLLTDSSGNVLTGYGASHAGIGHIDMTHEAAPTPNNAYGHYETPLSLGSGAGYYHNPYDLFGEETRGGGAVKLVARSGYITIDGTVNCNGFDGSHVGGAAGGSIWLIGWEIDGSGIMTAEGGSTLLSSNTGGGGGGYISLWHDRYNNFTGALSVVGKSGGTNGKIFTKQTEPVLEDRFTGQIWNEKWWDYTNSVTIDNNLAFDSSAGDYQYPVTNSLFYVSGETIITSLDYFPQEYDSTQYSSEFLLYADNWNWIGLARRKTGLFGISSVDGVVSASGMPFDDTNVTLRLLKNDSTFTYQFYDATSTPQTIYSDVRPELANKRFNVRMQLLKPESGDLFRTEFLRLTTLDISRQYYELDGTPSDQSDVAMNVPAGSSQYMGLDFYVEGNKVKWDSTDLLGGFRDIVAFGDIVRTIYYWDDYTSNDPINVVFDNFKVMEGIISNAETKDSVLYVDPDYGSDSCNGNQLTPLKNLFVATAWAKKGSTVVLYDGTHNPTAVARKNITIRGAEGVKPLITSANVLDSTGSGWENTALSLYGCQGMIDNVIISDTTNGIIVENGNFSITRNIITSTTNPITFKKCDPLIAQNRIEGGLYALDFSSSRNPLIISNVVFDASVAVRAVQTSDMTISSNTFDTNQTHIVLDSTSPAIISSNNLTYCTLGINASVDSSYSIYNNNFFGAYASYSRSPFIDSSNISEDPLYYDRPERDYHINPGSPNIEAGILNFDGYKVDYDGASRVNR